MISGCATHGAPTLVERNAWLRNSGGRRGAKGPVVDCEDMGNLFDIGVERLMAGGVAGTAGDQSEEARLADGLVEAKAAGLADSPCATGKRTFYLETFGCQMNEHDSEKVAGVLLARGYRQVGSVEAANVVLYNTCSIREKAAQKVFSRLGEFQPEGKKWQVASDEWRVSGEPAGSRRYQGREDYWGVGVCGAAGGGEDICQGSLG